MNLILPSPIEWVFIVTIIGLLSACAYFIWREGKREPTEMVDCFACGGSVPQSIANLDDGGLWFCDACVTHWELENHCHWETGEPFELSPFDDSDPEIDNLYAPGEFERRTRYFRFVEQKRTADKTSG